MEVIVINTFRINEEIEAKQVVLVSLDGNGTKNISLEEALQTAEDADLDLVEVSNNGTYPICKLMDYSKCRYEMLKKEKQYKKAQKTIATKEIHLSPNIGKNDLSIKVAAARKFLQKGHKVVVIIRFKGREIAYQNLGHDIIESFIQEVSDIADTIAAPKLEGRTLSATLRKK